MRQRIEHSVPNTHKLAANQPRYANWTSGLPDTPVQGQLTESGAFLTCLREDVAVCVQTSWLRHSDCGRIAGMAGLRSREEGTVQKRAKSHDPLRRQSSCAQPPHWHRLQRFRVLSLGRIIAAIEREHP